MKYLIVGLGNIGDKYAATRHNIGFRVLDAFAEASNLVFEDKRYGFVAQMRLKGHILTLLKPSTYMNLSGNAVRYWLQKENIPIENLLVVVDDLAQIPHSVGIPHRRTSEFIDFHVISLINLTYLPLPFAQLTAVLSRPMAAFTNLPHPKPLPREGLVATQPGFRPGFRPDLQPNIPK